jgi:cytidine deaminase
VRDGNGCTSAIDTAQLVINPLPLVTVANDTVCAGASAVFTALATGGSGSYTYNWNGTGFAAASTYTIDPANSSQSVTVVVQDSRGCTSATTTAQLVVGSVLHVTVANDTVCAGAAAVFTALPTGGSAPYTYNWNSLGFAAASTYTIDPANSSQSVTVVVQDSRGCTSATTTAQLVVGSVLHVTVANDTVCAGAAAVFTALASGGSAPYTYNWNSIGFAAASTYTINPANSSQSVTVVVQDSKGCTSALTTAQLVVGSLLHVTVGNDTVCAGSTAIFSALVTGGQAPYSYKWANGIFGAIFTYTVTPANTSKSITLMVKDASGCSATVTAQLVVRTKPTVTGLCKLSYCSGAHVNAINFNSSVSGTTFTWTSTTNVGFGTSGSGNIPAFTALGGSTLVTTTVTVVPSANGCTGNPATFVICINAVPNVVVHDTSVCKGNSVALIGSPAGGTWSGYGVSGSSFNAATISPGVYTVSYWMYGTGGCVGAANAIVTVKKCYCGCPKDNEDEAITEVTELVYPNPTTGAFVVSLPALKYDSRLTVFDLGGNVVEQRMIAKNDKSQEMPFDLSHMSRGLYFIQVLSGDKHYFYKVALR